MLNHSCQFTNSNTKENGKEEEGFLAIDVSSSTGSSNLSAGTIIKFSLHVFKFYHFIVYLFFVLKKINLILFLLFDIFFSSSLSKSSWFLLLGYIFIVNLFFVYFCFCFLCYVFFIYLLYHHFNIQKQL